MNTQMLLAGCEGRTIAWCHTTGAAPGGQMPREIFQAKSDYVTTPLPEAGRAAMIAGAEAAGSGALLCDAYGGASAASAPTRPRSFTAAPCFASSITRCRGHGLGRQAAGSLSCLPRA